jgi:hypothetical protein
MYALVSCYGHGTSDDGHKVRNVYEVRFLVLVFSFIIIDSLCSLGVRVPGYRTEKYCVSCEVRTECYVEESRPPLWSSDQSSWLQIQGSEFDSRRYQIFSEAVGLERGPLSLLSTTEELLERKCSCSGLEIREYGRRG